MKNYKFGKVSQELLLTYCFSHIQLLVITYYIERIELNPFIQT